MKKNRTPKRYKSDSRGPVLHRFFVSAQSFNNNNVRLTGSQAHQIRDVLRLKTGTHIVVLDNRGWEYESALTKIGRIEINAEVIKKRRAANEPKVRITLFQSMIKQQRFEWLLQKCTELGVSRFVPVLAHRSVLRKSENVKAKKLERWRRIVTEAAEQSHRASIPHLDLPVILQKGMAELKAFECSLMASTKAESLSLRNCLKGRRVAGGASIALVVGPEGGFTEDELEWARAGGAIPFSLGPRILRAETAAVVATSLILHEMGDLEG